MSRTKILASCVWMLLLVASAHAEPVAKPLSRAHAHNDYRHRRPLLDALDHGFTSVEADIFLRDGKLLVGHDTWELTPKRTLEGLYLDPLAARIKANDGSVHAEPGRFFLLIDIKDNGQATYEHLQKVLKSYDAMLTHVDGEKLTPGAVTIVLSGAGCRVEFDDTERRYCGRDGRLTNLDGTIPAHEQPMISDRWGKHFSWNGVGPMPREQREKLHDFVRKSHAAGREVRLWGTPENLAVWKELIAADVDLINTDQLGKLKEFSRK